MAAVMKCWYCKSIIEDKNNLHIEKINNVNRKFHKDGNCYDKFKQKKDLELKQKEEKAKITEGWDELYKYVKKEVLGYPDNMNLSNHARNSLQQLRSGGLIRNNFKITNEGYPYPIILMTFKVKKIDIDRALEAKVFENENQKFNYIMAIIKNSINDVYLRVLNKERRDKVIERQVKEEVVKPTNKVEYIRKSEVNNKGSLFDDMW